MVVAQYAAAAAAADDPFNQIFICHIIMFVYHTQQMQKYWRSVTLIHTDYAVIIIYSQRIVSPVLGQKF